MPLESMPSLQILVLRRTDHDRNMHRYYVLSITPALFGDTGLVREWGRIGQKGQRWIELHCKEAGAIEALNAWLCRKQRRGYVVVSAASRRSSLFLQT